MVSNQSNSQLLNSIETVQPRLDLGKTKVFELLKTGKLQSVKIGSKTLVTEENLRGFIASLSERHSKAA